MRSGPPGLLARRISVASVDGPATSGVASGTIKWIAARRIRRPPIRRGENHLNRDEEEKDSAGNSNRLLLDPEKRHQSRASKEEPEHQRQGDTEFAHDHFPPLISRHLIEYRHEARHIPERIHREQENADGREEFHWLAECVLVVADPGQR